MTNSDRNPISDIDLSKRTLFSTLLLVRSGFVDINLGVKNNVQKLISLLCLKMTILKIFENFDFKDIPWTYKDLT